MLTELLAQRDHWILIRGLLYCLVLSLPITAFVATMGSGAPESKGFFHSLAVVLGMVAGSAVAFFVILKIVDSGLALEILPSTFSFSGMVIASALCIVAGNIWVDDLYQFKQGNYSISVYAFLGLLAVCAFVVFIGRWNPWS